MNFKAWQTYVLIGVVVAHLLIVPGLLICSQVYPAIPPTEWRFCIEYSQCALLAVFAAFSRITPWKRWCLFFAGLVYAALMQIAGDFLANPIPLRFFWSDPYLRFNSNIIALVTCVTVVAWLPIRYWSYVDVTSQSRQFGFRQLFTVTFLTACLMMWYQLSAFGTAHFVIIIWEVLGLTNTAALGFAAALLSSNARWLGVAIIALSIVGLTLREWIDPVGGNYFQCVIGILGIIALTILLWRLAKMQSKEGSVASSSTPIEQTEKIQSEDRLTPMEKPLA